MYEQRIDLDRLEALAGRERNRGQPVDCRHRGVEVGLGRASVAVQERRHRRARRAWRVRLAGAQREHAPRDPRIQLGEQPAGPNHQHRAEHGIAPRADDQLDALGRHRLDDETLRVGAGRAGRLDDALVRGCRLAWPWTPRGRRRRHRSCARSRAEALTTNGAVPSSVAAARASLRAAAERRRGGRYAGCREQRQRLGLGGLGMGGQVELRWARARPRGRRPGPARAASTHAARRVLEHRKAGRAEAAPGRQAHLAGGPEHGEVRASAPSTRSASRSESSGRWTVSTRTAVPNSSASVKARSDVEDLGLLREHPAHVDRVRESREVRHHRGEPLARPGAQVGQLEAGTLGGLRRDHACAARGGQDPDPARRRRSLAARAPRRCQSGRRNRRRARRRGGRGRRRRHRPRWRGHPCARRWRGRPPRWRPPSAPPPACPRHAGHRGRLGEGLRVADALKEDADDSWLVIREPPRAARPP